MASGGGLIQAASCQTNHVDVIPGRPIERRAGHPGPDPPPAVEWVARMSVHDRDYPAPGMRIIINRIDYANVSQ